MNAQCVEGRCECLPGFEGDGILKCDKKGKEDIIYAHLVTCTFLQKKSAFS